MSWIFNLQTLLYYSVQGSDTRARTQKNPVGFFG